MEKSSLLWLEGTLQSWGASSLWRRRETLDYPTRSGVLGLLACAAGKGGEQEEWLASMAGFRQDVRAYAPRGSDGVPRMAPMLEDFQTVGCGWDRQTGAWSSMHVPRQSTGKISSTGPKILHKYYLQDMAFACVLELPEDEAAFLMDALAHPVWTVSLGRRCCVPSDFIPRGVFDTRDEAFAEADRIAAEKNRGLVHEVIDGSHPELGDVEQVQDVPLAFGLHPRYRARFVTVCRN